MKSFRAEVLLVEKPVVRENVANLASAMAQRRGDFDLLRGRRAEVTPIHAHKWIPAFIPTIPDCNGAFCQVHRISQRQRSTSPKMFFQMKAPAAELSQWS